MTAFYGLPEGVKDRGFEEIASLARKDMHSLNRLGDGEARVVDKLPINFLYLGLIALLYPGARAIHRKGSKGHGHCHAISKTLSIPMLGAATLRT